MPRYIDANELKESLKKFEATGNIQGYLQGIRDAVNDLFPQIIDDEPTADVEPVRHGRWIRVIGDDYECSKCKAAVWSTSSNPIERYKYCWQCGAKMDGGKNNETDLQGNVKAPQDAR